MTEPDATDDEADLTVALDIIDLRFRALEIASHEEGLAPKATIELANYYFNFGLTGLIVEYPPLNDNPKKPKLVK